MLRELIGAMLIALVFAIAFRIWRSVANRRSVQESTLPRLMESKGGLELGSALYVSTVFAARPLDRLWAFGLGSRGKSKVFASEDGVSIERVGESNFLIPTASIAGFTRETATIDKGVEQDGLIAIHWSHGKERLVTHLRVVNDPGGFLRQLAHVTGADIG